MMRIAVFLSILAVAVVVDLDSRAVAQSRASRVAVTRVIQKQFDNRQQYIGTVMASRTSSVGSAVDGRVVVLHVNEGDFVEEGQPLAQLLTETINLELEAAKAELELRRQELAELQNGARPEELAAARARMLAAKAFREFRVAQRKRSEELFRKAAINEDEYNESIAEADSAEQLFRAADENFKLVSAGPRAEKIAQGKARLAQQTAIVQNLMSRIRKFTIKAPFDGYVVAEHTESGEWIKQGELVADIIALDRVDVLIHVLEKHVSHVRRGLQVLVEIPALPNRQFSGRVVHVVPKADTKARTFPVKVQIENLIQENDPLIKSGMLARISLPAGPERRTVLIPKDALVLGGPRPVVFVVDLSRDDGAASKQKPAGGVSGKRTGKPDELVSQTGTVRQIPVTTGDTEGRLIEVINSLRPGELVVVRGNERLRTASEVVITDVLSPDAAPRASATGR